MSRASRMVVPCGRFLLIHFAKRNVCGITLFELVVASTLSLFVLIAIGQMNISREAHGQRIQQTSILRLEGGLALAHMAKRLKQADRVVLVSDGDVGHPPANILFRTPLGTTFDQASNYRWAQYRHVDTDGNGKADTLQFYDDIGDSNTPKACVVSERFAGLQGVTIVFFDAGPQPVGEKNALTLKVFLVDLETGKTATTYTAEVVLGGSGLATSGVSEPRPPCS